MLYKRQHVCDDSTGMQTFGFVKSSTAPSAASYPAPAVASSLYPSMPMPMPMPTTQTPTPTPASTRINVPASLYPSPMPIPPQPHPLQPTPTPQTTQTTAEALAQAQTLAARYSKEHQRLSAENAELQRAVAALKLELEHVSEAAHAERQAWAEERAALQQRDCLTSDAVELQRQLVDAQALAERLVQDKLDVLAVHETLQSRYEELMRSTMAAARSAAEPAAKAPLAPSAWDGDMIGVDASTDWFTVINGGVCANNGGNVCASHGGVEERKTNEHPDGNEDDVMHVTDAGTDADNALQKRRHDIKAQLQGMSETEVSRKFKVDALTEMLAAFGEEYCTPKLVAVQRLLTLCR
jgi:hypothetical protein